MATLRILLTVDLPDLPDGEPVDDLTEPLTDRLTEAISEAIGDYHHTLDVPARPRVTRGTYTLASLHDAPGRPAIDPAALVPLADGHWQETTLRGGR